MNNHYSNLKIFRHPLKIESFEKNKTTSPLYVRIKPINLCDHGCFFCVYSTGFRVKDDPKNHINSGMHADMKERDIIHRDKMVEILNDLSSMGVKAITWSGGGEPLLHPNISEFINLAKNLKMQSSIITNGTLLKGRNAEALKDSHWVRVSIDYFDSKSIKKFRNIKETNFSKILNNIKNFALIKDGSTNLGVNYIIHKDNYKGIYDITSILKDHGVENIRYSPMYSNEFYTYHNEIYKDVNNEIKKTIKNLNSKSFQIFSSYPDTINENNIRHGSIRTYKRCYIMETVPVIGADLNVYACHNKAYDNTGLIGSLESLTFKELWFSDKTRKLFNNFNPKLKCMHECANDNKNIIINDYINNTNDFFI
jgi:MoaA/NifB/PqqE/SkfB family radical SAM enzyme